MTTQTVSDAFWVCLYGLMLIAVLDLSYAILQSMILLFCYSLQLLYFIALTFYN